MEIPTWCLFGLRMKLWLCDFSWNTGTNDYSSLKIFHQSLFREPVSYWGYLCDVDKELVREGWMTQRQLCKGKSHWSLGENSWREFMSGLKQLHHSETFLSLEILNAHAIWNSVYLTIFFFLPSFLGDSLPTECFSLEDTAQGRDQCDSRVLYNLPRKFTCSWRLVIA